MAQSPPSPPATQPPAYPGGPGGTAPGQPPGWAQAGPSRPPPTGGRLAASRGLVEALDPLCSSFLAAERREFSFYIYQTAQRVGWHLETASQPPAVPTPPLPRLLHAPTIFMGVGTRFGSLIWLSILSVPTVHDEVPGGQISRVRFRGGLPTALTVYPSSHLGWDGWD